MSRLLRSLAWVGLPVAAALSGVVGCDVDITIPKPQADAPVATPAPGPPPETNNAFIMAHRAGQEAGLMLEMDQFAKLMFQRVLLGTPMPADWDSLIASDPANKDFYTKLRDAGVVVVWNAADFEKQVGPSNTILAYGPWVVQQGGPVATLDGRASQMSAEDLKAKLAAMGVEPVEAAPAPAAEGAAPVSEVPAPAEGAAPEAVTPAP